MVKGKIMTQRAPAMYVGHGSPMFALQPGKAGVLLNEFSRYFTDVKAVLIISPHWMTRGLALTASDNLETIHDFYGFPDPLYRVNYKAPGNLSIAEAIQRQLKNSGYEVSMESNRGRDHGVWVPMLHLLPEERIPVLQLSFDRTLDANARITLGENLKSLREQGIAVIASGSLTHNLYELKPEQAPPVAYADRFEKWVRQSVKNRDTEQLGNPEKYCDDFKRAHPTAEHYMPLLVAMGASDETDQLQVLEGGILHGVISMESYGWV